MKNQSRFWRYLLLMLAIAIVSGVSYVMAEEVWVGPGTNPPDGNRSRPIDTSSSFQVKAGSLRLQEGLYVGDYSDPSKSDDNFQLTSAGTLFLRGSAEMNGSDNVTALHLYAHGTEDPSSVSALSASNDGTGWSGYFLGAPVGIEKYLIVGPVPVGAVPAVGNGYFSGNIYLGASNGDSQLCLNGSEAANCISSFEDVGGADLWQLAGAGPNIYYNAGKVGVGTTTPSEKMEIAFPGVGVARLRVTDVDAEENPEIQLQYGAVSTDHWALYVSKSNSNNLQIWGGGADRVAIDQNGKVGINTLFPKAKLDVWGRTKTQQVVTDELQINDVNYGSFGGSLWVGKDLGNISVCSSSDDSVCDSVLDIAGNSNITSSVIFNGRLFLGMSDGHLMSCDSKPTCQDLGQKAGGSITDLVIFNNRLWLATSSVNQIYSCDASGVCSSYNSGANESLITGMVVYDGSLWLISGRQLFSCSATGICQLKFDAEVNQIFKDLIVYNGSLFIAGDWGESEFVWSCDSSGSCDDLGGLLVTSVNKLAVFADKLWIGHANGRITSCNSSFVCNDYDVSIASGTGIESLAVFNGYLWVGAANGKLTYCNTSGSCNAIGYDLTNSVNSLIVYDYPTRSCSTFSRIYDECTVSPLAEEADLVAPASQPNTGKCFNGWVMIKKTACEAGGIPEDPLSQGNYCGLKCPAGTTSATGGCQTVGDYRSISGQQLRYFYNASNPLAFSDSPYDWGWECQVTEGHILSVWVICQGNFLTGTFNPDSTSPCPMGT